MLIPFPLNVASLFEFLTSISINVQYIRPRDDLPKIPIRRLRIFELFRIDGGIPWWLFMAVGGMHNFESLEDLRLEFILAAGATAKFPDSNFLVLFPRLNRLHITGATYVYTDIRGYFKDRYLDSLTIVDDPVDFKDTSENALENVKVLKIGHRAGTPDEDRHSEEAVERLYNLPSSAKEAVLRFVDYPLPQMITWVNLRSLGMSISIADKCRVANLVRQLPHLNRLVIDCFSMIPTDAKNTRFPDQKDVPKLLKDALKPSNRPPISQSLVHLELTVRGNFDTYGFSKLLSRLPQVTCVKTNNDNIPSIIDFLARDFMGHRDIHYFGWG
ncbi:hypothetical protein FBU59_000690 [Linderina macrospora]|uniref:Uncharacterized protein n=1 Tax=Linderina macrospora TaxID=4868 RepID=A0ACC1JG53_9FUNG|nr:hypothetical protein FBU59_000690 [Linderina macrospora]